MSALPDNPNAPAVSATSPDTDRPDEPRHLHAVPPTDVNAADPEEEPAAPPDEPDTATTGESRWNWAASTAWLRTAFAPDSGLYADRQPSIAETMRRARHGSQFSAVGPLRAASTTHGYVATVNKAAAHTWVWIVDHPARLGVLTLLLTLAVLYPPTRHLIGYLLTPLVWAQHALLA